MIDVSPKGTVPFYPLSMYMKTAVFLIIILAVIMPGRAVGAFNAAGEATALQDTTGTITAIKRNRIVILEDGTHLKRSFLYMRRDIDQFLSGERVRIYFRNRYSTVISVKKMTVLKYNKEKQNLGYITREIKE